MTTSNAADGSKIINKRHTQSEECGVYSRIMRNNLVQLGNLYSIQTHCDSIPTKRWDIGTLTHLSLFYTIFREKLKKITVIEINYSQGQWNTEQTAQTYV